MLSFLPASETVLLLLMLWKSYKAVFPSFFNRFLLASHNDRLRRFIRRLLPPYISRLFASFRTFLASVCDFLQPHNYLPRRVIRPLLPPYTYRFLESFRTFQLSASSHARPPFLASLFKTLSLFILALSILISAGVNQDLFSFVPFTGKLCSSQPSFQVLPPSP